MQRVVRNAMGHHVDVNIIVESIITGTHLSRPLPSLRTLLLKLESLCYITVRRFRFNVPKVCIYFLILL